MKKMIRKTLIALSVMGASSVCAGDYVYVIGAENGVQQLSEVANNMKSFYQAKQGDRHIIIKGTTGELWCQYQVNKNNATVFKKLAKGCRFDLADTSVHSLNIPAVMASVGKLGLSQDSRVLLFGSTIYNDAANQIDFSYGFPSDAHLLHPFGHLISPFSNGAAKLDFNQAKIYWTQPQSDSHKYLNLKHKVGVERFYVKYFQTLNASLIGIDTSMEMLKNQLAITNPSPMALANVDYVDEKVIRTHDVRPVPEKKADTANASNAKVKSKWRTIPLPASFSIYRGTAKAYSLPLENMERVEAIRITEFDGDDNGNNIVLVFGIDANDQSQVLGEFKPSGSMVAKTSNMTLASPKMLKEVLIVPVKARPWVDHKAQEFDNLGGAWQINQVELLVK